MTKSIGWPFALMLLLQALVMRNGVCAEPSAPQPASRLLLAGSSTMAPLVS
jgi:hypothetical protein